MFSFLEAEGPIAIKFAQWASTRPDILPRSASCRNALGILDKSADEGRAAAKKIYQADGEFKIQWLFFVQISREQMQFFKTICFRGAFCDNFGATVITVIIFKVFLINKLLACWHNLPPDLPPTAFGSEIQGLWPSLSFTGPETSIWEPSWPSCLILGFIVPRCCSACYKCYSELKIQSPNVLEASVRPHSFRQTKRQVVHKVSRRSTQIAEFGALIWTGSWPKLLDPLGRIRCNSLPGLNGLNGLNIQKFIGLTF